MGRAREIALLALLSCKEAPPPLGEALIVVDTDAPVPMLAARLRVDLYTESGEWYDSRDVAAPDRSAWPISFSVFTPDESAPRTVLLRLRAYPESKTRDYRGTQRLVANGVDTTPASEPQPLLTMDRLLRVRLEPGRVGSVRTVLRGMCFGTAADLASGASCVDQESTRVPLATSALDPDMTLPRESVAGSFGASTPCAGAPRAGEVCVPGGVFIFGNDSNYGSGESSGVPERVALIPAFYMDRHEFTVARWRAAYLTDKTAFAVGLNEGPLDRESTNEIDRALCTASDGAQGREDYALSCVRWGTARALCQRDGGDLPTEAQWEYAAQLAGRAAKTIYPWAVDTLSCDRAVYGRLSGGTGGRNACKEKGFGPLPVATAERDDGDVSPLGIIGLGGGVSEWARDAFFGYDAPCWTSKGLVEPSCDPDASVRHTTRGGDWTSNALGVAAQERRRVDSLELSSPGLGFRCVRGAK